MKSLHHTGAGRFLAVGYALLVHGAFAIGAYFFGEFLSGYIFNGDNPLIIQVSAGFFALMVFAGAIWGFIYMEYAKEDVEAYKQKSGKNFHPYLYAVQLCIAGLEVASLAYRVYVIPDGAQRWIVAIFGLLALAIAFCLGKIIHAMANRPLESYVARAHDTIARSVVTDALNSIDDMTIEERKAYLAGDATGLDNARARKNDKLNARDNEIARKNEEKTRKQQEKERAAEEKYTRDNNIVSQILSPFTAGASHNTGTNGSRRSLN